MCLVIEQNEVCGAHIRLKTGSVIHLVLKYSKSETEIKMPNTLLTYNADVILLLIIYKRSGTYDTA